MSWFKKAEPQTVQVKGYDLQCPVCRNNTFFKRSAMLNTFFLTFFDLDWADRSATCFVCSDCTHISWFSGK